MSLWSFCKSLQWFCFSAFVSHLFLVILLFTVVGWLSNRESGWGAPLGLCLVGLLGNPSMVVNIIICMLLENVRRHFRFFRKQYSKMLQWEDCSLKTPSVKSYEYIWVHCFLCHICLHKGDFVLCNVHIYLQRTILSGMVSFVIELMKKNVVNIWLNLISKLKLLQNREAVGIQPPLVGRFGNVMLLSMNWSISLCLCLCSSFLPSFPTYNRCFNEIKERCFHRHFNMSTFKINFKNARNAVIRRLTQVSFGWSRQVKFQC